MEMKKAQRPSNVFQASLALGLLLVCAQFSNPVEAEEFLCQATQASEKELPMLEKTCPIGNGVWGKKVPQGGQLPLLDSMRIATQAYVSHES
ncbi:hypothetical protein HLBS07_00360 [Vibrio alginolyticus]|nr:hypothetical protein HLBS07_00360 [Vibrio alginolyticus]